MQTGRQKDRQPDRQTSEDPPPPPSTPCNSPLLEDCKSTNVTRRRGSAQPGTPRAYFKVRMKWPCDDCIMLWSYRGNCTGMAVVTLWILYQPLHSEIISIMATVVSE